MPDPTAGHQKAAIHHAAEHTPIHDQWCDNMKHEAQ
jgi:hypothetical protein